MNLSTNATFDLFTIEELNQAKIKSLTPNTVLLVLWLVASFVGNGMVLYVYTFKLKIKTDDRYFIPCLAVLDIFTCLVGSIFGIILNSNPLMFRHNLICSLVWTTNMFGAVSCAFLLFAIGVQRYKKVCAPFNPSISLRTRRIAVVIVIVGSSILAIPCMFLYGEAEVHVTSGNFSFTGYTCDSKKEANKDFLFWYSILMMAVCFVAVLTYTILYCKLLQTIYKQASIWKKNPSTDPLKSSGMLAVCRTAIKKHKISIMFFLVTVLFILSYFPRLILTIIESVTSDFWELMTNTKYAVVLSLYRAYLLNNVVNPIIYYFFDSAFKAEIKHLCSRK